MGFLDIFFGKTKQSSKIKKEHKTRVLAPDKIKRKGLPIATGMIIDVIRKGKLYKAYNDSGIDYSTVVSNTRRKKAWESKKGLKARINVFSEDYPEDFRITWSLVDSPRRADLVKKYGEEDGLRIFYGEIEESDYLNGKTLVGEYGDKFGQAILNKKILKGMTLDMVEKAIGKTKYKTNNECYFGKPFNYAIAFEDDKVTSHKKLKKSIWLDMKKTMLVASWGRPIDEKEDVSKNIIKLRWYYGARKTRQKTTKYKYEVRLENDLVVGWKELE